jgi:hypothetical protein
MKLVVEQVVGYMLKVMKSGIKITTYRDEFNAIRHADYGTFLNLVKGPLPFMMKWHNGVISEGSHNPNYDCDFEGLYKSGPSLMLFYKKCMMEYGKIEDKDIPDNIFHKVVTFEIAIRMHANNYKLLSTIERTDLITVIEVLCAHKNINETQKEKVQKAREVVNMIKHFKHQFPTWEEGVRHFKEGYKVLIEHDLLIFNNH